MDLGGDKGVWFLLGALATFFLQLALRRYQMRVEAYSSRIEDLTEVIREAAEKGVEYWLLASDKEELPKLEAQIFGLNFRANGLAGYLIEDWDVLNGFIEDELFEFSDALTGGEFQVKGRATDPVRCALVERKATALEMALRRAERSYLRPWF